MSNTIGQAWMLGMLLLVVAAIVLGAAYVLFSSSGMELAGFSVFERMQSASFGRDHPLAIAGLVIAVIIGMFIYESSTSGKVSGFM